MMTQEAFASALAAELQAEYGFDPASILALLQLLAPLIKQLPCFKKNAKVMAANITDEYRACCKKRSNRCPAKARKVMAMQWEEEVIDRGEQDDIWAALAKVAFVNHESVALALVA